MISKVTNIIQIDYCFLIIYYIIVYYKFFNVINKNCMKKLDFNLDIISFR